MKKLRGREPIRWTPPSPARRAAKPHHGAVGVRVGVAEGRALAMACTAWTDVSGLGCVHGFRLCVNDLRRIGSGQPRLSALPDLRNELGWFN
jgi:hypothetical protein